MVLEVKTDFDEVMEEQPGGDCDLCERYTAEYRIEDGQRLHRLGFTHLEFCKECRGFVEDAYSREEPEKPLFLVQPEESLGAWIEADDWYAALREYEEELEGEMNDDDRHIFLSVGVFDELGREMYGAWRVVCGPAGWPTDDELWNSQGVEASSMVVLDAHDPAIFDDIPDYTVSV